MEQRNLQDDPENIPDHTLLYRRTTWAKLNPKQPGHAGDPCCEITPNFFTDAPLEEAFRFGFNRPCMSVGTSLVLGDEPERMLETFPQMGLVVLSAGALRALEKGDGPCPQGIMLAPTDDEPWHAVVFDINSPKRSGGGQKAIAKLARVIVPLHFPRTST